MAVDILGSSQAACTQICEVVRLYQEDMALGLSKMEADARLLYHGHNEFKAEEEDSLAKKVCGLPSSFPSFPLYPHTPFLTCHHGTCTWVIRETEEKILFV